MEAFEDGGRSFGAGQAFPPRKGVGLRLGLHLGPETSQALLHQLFLEAGGINKYCFKLFATMKFLSFFYLLKFIIKLINDIHHILLTVQDKIESD